MYTVHNVKEFAFAIYLKKYILSVLHVSITDLFATISVVYIQYLENLLIPTLLLLYT